MDLYQIYQLGLKIKYGVPISEEITAEDMIKNNFFTDLAREIKELPEVDKEVRIK